jgi:hypothetical protein
MIDRLGKRRIAQSIAVKRLAAQTCGGDIVVSGYL